jgi:hypothetical protein
VVFAPVFVALFAAAAAVIYCKISISHFNLYTRAPLSPGAITVDVVQYSLVSLHSDTAALGHSLLALFAAIVVVNAV